MKNLFLLSLLVGVFVSCQTNDSYFSMRGVILSVEDLETVDWPKLASENGINTIGTHITPEQVASFIESEKGQKFMADCKKYNILVEHQLHAMKDLLPRGLFAEDSTMFRMDENGHRVADFNCCVSSSKALNIIAENAAKYARILPATNHKYYYWLDDGAPVCACSECVKYSPSEQALIVENKMIEKIRTVDPEAQLAHLAYHNTMKAPRKVKPAEGIFLEFAPFYRSWEKPIADESASGRGMTHIDNIKYLRDNLTVFPAETAVILEYWLDVSLFSAWKKPAVQLPWHKDVFLSDIKTYAEMGIRQITSFAVYMDDVYFNTYPDLSFLKEYGMGMKDFQADPSVKKPEVATYSVKTIPDGTLTVDGIKNEREWDSSEVIDNFVNHWNKPRSPYTSLRLLKDSEYLYFFFDAVDDDIILDENDTTEMCVTKEDRVELFFSTDKELSLYYGFEIDPLGRVLDYSVNYYRKFHYDWSFNEIVAAGQIHEKSYSMEGSIPLKFLYEVSGGKDELYWGAYRGEFFKDEEEKVISSWMSIIDPQTFAPDFHVPSSFCKLILK